MVANTTGLSKVKGYESERFYMLRESEVLKMRKVGLMPNNTFIYFALKLENPFCDCPIQIDIDQFSEQWGVNRRAIYRYFNFITNLGLAFIKNFVLFSWINPDRPERKKEKLTELSQTQKPTLSSENSTASDSTEPVLTELSQAENEILVEQTNQNFDETEPVLTELSQNCQNCQNQSLKPLSANDFRIAHTIHTKNTNSYSINSKNEIQEREKSNFKLEETDSQKEKNQELEIDSQDQEQKIEENIKNLNKDTFCAASTSIECQQEDSRHKADRQDEQEAVKPWLDVNGDFKQELVDYLAKQWVEKYPDNNPNIHVARSNAISHLNKPMKARQRWNEYQSLLEARKNSNYRDYTGYHEKQKEEIPPNPKAIALLAEYLKGLRKNPK
ncbi:hypothetical protein [Geminocystis sp. NIES-3709]|uniref:hypothetical protein n=1 Tax=Geminocystis sp. NIES-3709 TaxID=1617448 RepID=UPI0005FC8414|nr:hypothetical protein [Geminocystis sp. NIES-3709]BAQ67160.1 hypothetical protein GM3709_3925 [Geminocystis sp. NIES-3709]